MKTSLIFPELAEDILVNDEDSLPTRIARRLLHYGGSNYLPPLSLMMLGAVTPPEVEVEIVDERFERIDFDRQVDLVGISVVTRLAPRAYEIADEYRHRGVKVVLGGIHPTTLPREAIEHADSVVIGEGEEAWPRVLSDFKCGRLQPFYKGLRRVDLNTLPVARRDLFHRPQDYLTMNVVMASRGCPNSCSFCSAHLAVGKKRRVRSIENVMAEVDQLKGGTVLFLDDNLGWDVDYAKQLFRELTPLKTKWFCSASLSAFEDAAFVELAAKSGCNAVSIGFESISRQSILNIRKQQTNDPARYAPLIRRMHDHGILVIGNFILGFDDDDRNVFESLVQFINDNCVEIPNISTLTPYPGTSLFRQFEREGRLLHTDWTEYDPGGFVVYNPKRMTRRELIDGYLDTVAQVHSIQSMGHRFVGAGTIPSIYTPLAGLHWSLKQRASLGPKRQLL